jgi:hypothetical protein
MDKQIAKIEAKIATQEAHVARMIAHDPKMPSIKSAIKIVEMYRAKLAAIKAVR